MKWNKLTKMSLPPVDNRKRFILWPGAHEDGGFPVVAAHVQYGDNPSYIRYVTMKGWKLLEVEDFSGCMWAEIEPPEEAKAAREKWENKCLGEKGAETHAEGKTADREREEGPGRAGTADRENAGAAH